MKKKLSTKELAEIRKKELARKELEFQLGRDLRIEDEKRKVNENALKDKSPFIVGCINFLGTMVLGYVAFILVKMSSARFLAYTPEVIPNVIFAVSHVVIWGISIIAVVRKKSPFDNWLP
ncbi:MAG: hypothetical protein BalsKO_07880 [Balneolaceae bacterium]